MPRGGARVGAGRKKAGEELTPARILALHRPKKPETPAPPAAPVDMGTLAEPPGDLPASGQAIWRLLAPYAVGEKTLKDETTPGFKQLCLATVYVAELDKTIERLGAGTKEAEPYLRTRDKQAKFLDTLQARFKLTAFGKPAVNEKPKPAANPWAQVAK